MTEGCVLCGHDSLREADLYFENDFCIYSSIRDPRDPPDVIPGCGAIVPKVHRGDELRSDLSPPLQARTARSNWERAGRIREPGVEVPLEPL